ncbi:glycosyltransferase family 2 protein [Pontibacter populi]|uniref:Glycosyltransferase family 2 protein n=1 Tax=Pontibacter populi TaxID=890055 RepID=A0ABV1RVV8_9BACT
MGEEDQINMTEKPLVSVLMTAYNREKYISEAIESVLASSYDNFELIIVDDQSKDNTVVVAEKYAKVDPRIIIYINEINLGDYPNRNKAASYAVGKYLKYVDADDKINTDCIEIMVKMMEEFPEAGYGICPAEKNPDKNFPYELTPVEAYTYQYFRNIGVFNRSPLCAIINRKAFELVGGFINKRMVGDYEMWHKLSLHYSVVIIPQGLVWYRNHDEQEQNHLNLFLLDYLIIAEKKVLKSPLSNEQRQIVLNKLRRNMFMKLLKNPMDMSFKERWKFYLNSSINISKLLHNTDFFNLRSKI